MKNIALLCLLLLPLLGKAQTIYTPTDYVPTVLECTSDYITMPYGIVYSFTGVIIRQGQLSYYLNYPYTVKVGYNNSLIFTDLDSYADEITVKLSQTSYGNMLDFMAAAIACDTLVGGGGGSTGVDTSGYNTDLAIDADSLKITDDNGTLAVDLSPYLDNTDTSGYNTSMTITLDTLYLEDASGILLVSLVPYLDNTDTSGYNVSMEIVGDTLYLEDADGTLSVPLVAYLDNTDTSGYNISMTVSSDTLYLTDGDSTLFVELPAGSGGLIDSLGYYSDTLRIYEDGNSTYPQVVEIVAGGPGGSVSIIEHTYAEMDSLITNALLVEGQFYNITDASGTDLGFITQAVQTNEITVTGTGGYLNADFQAAGDYSGVEAITGVAAGAQLGIWRPSFETTITINYTNLTGGTFFPGETIYDTVTYAEAIILTDDGVSLLTANLTSPGLVFNDTDFFESDSVYAEVSGIPILGTQTGDIVIWNLKHWQCIDSTLLDGTDPATNTAAYQELLKTDILQGYIEAWDKSEFDFVNNWLQYRADNLGNRYRYEKLFDDESFGLGYTGILDFQWGNYNWVANVIENGLISGVNELGGIAFNTLASGAYIANNTMLFGAYIINNTLANNSYISDNELNVGSIITYNILGLGARLYQITLDFGANISFNQLSTAALMQSSGATHLAAFESVAYNEIGNNFSGLIGSTGFNNRKCTTGFSNFSDTIDITGLTTLNTTVYNDYVGIFYLTSSNASETIDKIVNFPLFFPFTLRPVPGLAVTFTATSIGSAVADDIVLPAASFTADGDNQDWIQFEVDPDGVGFSKYVNGVNNY